ncbi:MULTISPECIES: glycerol kinase GlpK [Marinobacter]|jgi:glycerol kinase|uniref:Glycerol kinase n=1 Tax=Marinobacter salarius TaxID=1420917 RepID=A0A1W6K8N0_9GAMM|nr:MULTISPECIES: glycerol kinase GlpK [Marinobacter]MBL84463.1 glycerol kinase [Marinobacter sp.]ARM83774.1 glycerol kinase [Marinobacter salarius]KXJ45305.1 MAG: glycerol kinase [Marinobacter sp. Hex_13]MBS8230802.1 glycerol kinase [Marinobacter salarius]MCC4282571.1 glycerol kinase GlpK [Marinobacter salarius]|tara:strand:+ start:64 stop:1536 length:1473 start_codon:yes stop_codon:yes gene_type:complete
MTQYILSIDQGTTSSRAILFTLDGNIHATSQQEFPQHFPASGWVEHEPEDIWRTVQETCDDVMAKGCGDNDEVVAVGITNQRETTVLWDRATGEAIYPAIVWQDRRTADWCESLKKQSLEPSVNNKTGLLIDPYFSATKIRWILDNVPGAQQRAERGELAFGTIDSFLLWRLTGGREHRTDATNASRTLLFNIHDQDWDPELLDLFGIPASLLPQVMDSAADFGQIVGNGRLGGTSVMGMAGDQQAALFGQTCFETGMAKSTYGTGCFLMLNTGDKALTSEHRLLTTVAYRLNGKPAYALEGSIFIAGAAIQWLRDGLQLIRDACETEPLAEGTPVDHGVYLVPAFTGLGAPYWDPNARGAIFGLTRDTGIKEIVTAGLQSVCYQTKDLQKAMEKDGIRPITLRVDGGMVANNWVLQFLADILGARVDRPALVETTALGAAYLAGLQAGVYKSLEDLSSMWRCDRSFEATMTKAQRDKLYDGWLKAIRKL